MYYDLAPPVTGWPASPCQLELIERRHDIAARVTASPCIVWLFSSVHFQITFLHSLPLSAWANWEVAWHPCPCHRSPPSSYRSSILDFSPRCVFKWHPCPYYTGGAFFSLEACQEPGLELRQGQVLMKPKPTIYGQWVWHNPCLPFFLAMFGHWPMVNSSQKVKHL